MTLYILSDEKELSWLKYITEEFVRINDAHFRIIVDTIEKKDDLPAENIIIYSEINPEKGHWLQNCSSEVVNPSHQNHDRLTVLNQCIVSDKRSIFNFDILFNSFVLLSRKIEYQKELSGVAVQSYRQKLNVFDKNAYSYTSVNASFNLLENKITTLFPSLKFGVGNKTIVELSHDLDYLHKTIQLRIKQGAFNTFNALRNIYKPIFFVNTIYKTALFTFRNSKYGDFNYWSELERSFEMRSVFYVYSQYQSKDFKTWLVDPSYNVTTNKSLQNSLKLLISEGHEIGIHGSFNSYNNPDLARSERDQLSTVVNTPVIKSRQHWLRYSELHTPAIHEQLYKFDSTVAWNDCPGFRAFCCSRYRPYDHKNNRIFDYMITPQVIMDSQLYDYAPGKGEQALETAFKIMESAYSYKNSYFSISWHPRTCHADYKWHEAYEKLLKKIQTLRK